MPAAITRHRCYAARLVTLCGLALCTGASPVTATAQARPALGVGQGGASECRAVSERSSALNLPGDVVAYIDPSTVLHHRGVDVILGVPSYVSFPAVAGRAARTVRDSVVGAIRSIDGRWALIASPLPGRHPFALKAAMRAPGLWDVIFVELDAPFNPRTSDSTLGVWHGVLRGTRWEGVTRVPFPDSLQLQILGISRLVRTGDTLSFGATYGLRRARGISGAVLLEYAGDAWRWRVLPWETTWAEVQATRQGQRRLIAARAYRNVVPVRQFISVHTLDDSLTVEAEIAQRNPYGPTIVPSGASGLMVTYQTQDSNGVFRWHAVDLQAAPTIARRIDFDSVYSRVSGIRGFGDARSALWIAHFQDTTVAPARLDLFASQGSGVRRFASLANPFPSAPPAYSSDSLTVRLLGPVFAQTASGPRLQSLLLTIDVSCRE